MPRRRHAPIAIALLLATAALTGFVQLDARRQAGQQLFQDVLGLVATRFVDSLDVSSVYEKAAEGLLTQLNDPYAELYSPAELDEFTATHQGHYGGLGMLVEQRDGVPTIARVYPNTPAEAAGMHVGDKVLAVDGDVVAGWPLEKVTGRMKGPANTSVELRFERPGLTNDIEVAITRAIIQIPTVPYAMVLDDGVGYLPLLQFGETAAEEVAASVEKLKAEGASSILLDLRGNGGGLLDQAVEVAGVFLPRGTGIVDQKERAGSQTFRTAAAAVAGDIPLVVLVDQGSASASEIVAGALQDHDRAVVLGQTTFGKGIVQTAFRVDGGYVLKMTTGEWFTPLGRNIHRKREIVEGRLVDAAEEAPDTALADRPTYRSDAGRTIYGGGGIIPDMRISQDTLSTAEQQYLQAVLKKSNDYYAAFADYAFELKDTVQPDFVVTQAWRDEFFSRLEKRGVPVTRAQYDAAHDYVDFTLGERVARLAFGDAQAKRWALKLDTQLMRALDLAAGKATQQELFAAATSGKRSS
jgi:carboxyl-terminal processing protease